MSITAVIPRRQDGPLGPRKQEPTMVELLIPKRFKCVSFDSYVPETPSQIEAIAAVHAWMLAIEDGPMLALVGKQGTGKSHLLYAAARSMLSALDALDAKTRWERGLTSPLVASWYRLSDELRYGKTVQTEGGGREVTAAEVRLGMWSRRVVVLDEVRPTSGTHFDDTELAKFACHAYDDKVAVLLTTNWNPLAAVMGEAAASRFSQVVIDGPDARQAA